MSEVLRTLKSELVSLERRIQKIRARHVNAQHARNAAKGSVQRYFAEWRGSLVAVPGTGGHLLGLDGEMHELLRCTQRRALVNEYRHRLRAVGRAIDGLELLILGAPAQRTDSRQLETRQQKILEMLHPLCPSAAASYEQGLEDLAKGERKSWRGPAVDFREALREVLDVLAPDQELARQPGFKLESNTNTPTMKQKAVFILRARRPKDSQTKAFADAVDVIEEAIGKFVRSVYSRSSTAVHVQESKDEAARIKNYVSLVLAELLEIKD